MDTDNKAIIKNFVELQERLALFFADREKGLGKKKYYYDMLGISKSTFDRKLKGKSFTADELEKIIDEISEKFNF